MKIELDLMDTEVRIAVRALDAAREHCDALHERQPELGYWDDAQAYHDLANKIAAAADLEIPGRRGYVYGRSGD